RHGLQQRCPLLARTLDRRDRRPLRPQVVLALAPVDLLELPVPVAPALDRLPAHLAGEERRRTRGLGDLHLFVEFGVGRLGSGGEFAVKGHGWAPLASRELYHRKIESGITRPNTCSACWLPHRYHPSWGLQRQRMHGLLFSSDFLREGIRETRGWLDAEQEFLTFRDAIGRIYADVHDAGTWNEAQTEEDIIEPVLGALGWNDRSSQANASARGRHDVPDFLLFGSAQRKRLARAERNDARRYRHGLAIVEAKRWNRALDRSEGSDPMDAGTPSSQMLRYLSRVEVASDTAVQWGILTNGRIWRLYWQKARSRSEEFLEFDLAALAGVAGTTGQLFAPSSADDVHFLRAFFLLFRRSAFLPQPGDEDGRSFHAIAL